MLRLPPCPKSRAGKPRGRKRALPSRRDGASGLGDFSQLLRVRERPELLQALVLDLPDPLAGHVERPPHLVECPGMLAVEAVAELEDRSLARCKAAEDSPQRLLAQRHLRGLVRERLALVGEEVPELRLLLVADGLLERDRRLPAPADVLHLVGAEGEVLRDLPRERLPAQLGAQLPLGTDDLVQLLDDVHRHADRARLAGERPRRSLPDPPGRIRRELEALAVVELLSGSDEADRALLDQIEERQPLVAVLLRDR